MLAKNLLRKHLLPSFLLQTRSYPRGNRYEAPTHVKKGDAGLRRQVRILGNIQEYLDDPEGLGNHESDFMSLHKVHKDYERDVSYNDEKISNIMIKNKYFKDAGPNFLTWAEKEQIRKLHTNDPEDWTIERLAESFPATVEIIAKVTAGKWYPKNVNRVQKHDESVKKNWARFHKNEMNNLDQELVEHLKKFSHRNFDNTSNNVNLKAIAENEFKFPKPQRTEFARIITSCKKQKDETTPNTIETKKPTYVEAIADGIKQTTPSDNDSYLLGPIVQRKLYQFDDIIKTKQVQKLRPKEDAAVTMSPYQTDNTDDVITLKPEDLIIPETKVQKYDSNSASLFQERLQPMTAANVVRERLSIPARLYKRGATYQFKDCFYDSTGEFLYRVPGLFASNNR